MAGTRARTDAAGRLSARQELIEAELGRLLARGNDRLYEVMRYAVLGPAKRFRPLLVLAAAESLGARPAQALPFACGVELIHSYSLVHDDLPCMDDDAMRRGKPSCHKAFGEDVALLAGDALLTLAFEVMAGAAVPARLWGARNDILLEAARYAGVDGMIGGQLLDITYTGTRPDILEEVMRKKTGALIELSVRAGALIAGAARPQRAALTEYARRIGTAFQVRDDILDAGETGRKPGQEKPNFAAFAGLGRAQERLQMLVEEARLVLEKAGLDSPLLVHLAERLLRY